MKLSEQQLQFFDTFGFLTFPSLFSKDIDAITDSFENVWANHGSGHHVLKRIANRRARSLAISRPG